jgi:hypothetical protein
MPLRCVRGLSRHGSVEDPAGQCFPGDPEMCSHVVENTGERTDTKSIVLRDGDVMLLRRVGGQAHVTSRLPRH